MTDIQELYNQEKASEIDEYEQAKMGHEVTPYPISLKGENCQVTSIRTMMLAAGDTTPIVEQKSEFLNKVNEAK